MALLKHDLPKLPATIFAVGACGSGKSSILWSLINEGYMYKGKSIFDEAVIYLGSMDSVSTFEKLPIKNKKVLTEFIADDFEEYLTHLKAHQLERLSKGKRPLNILICFDDFVGVNLMKRNGAKGSPLERLALTSRHEANATICYLAQAYRNTGFSHPVVRNNITTFILAQMKRPEVEKIADEISIDMTNDEFVAVYEKIMSKRPYNYMVFDNRRPLDSRWTERFTIPIEKPMRLMKSLDMNRNAVPSTAPQTDK